MRSRARFAGALLLLLWVAARPVHGVAAPVAYQPLLIYSVSDDTLNVPLGAVLNVAVGYDGSVYLLDKQTFNVRRFGPEGSELASLGHEGEGPGEFSMPRNLSVDSNGRCLVLQDFYQPAVCLTSEGNPCEPPDLQRLRAPYFLFLVARAQIDASGRLIVGVITTPRDGVGSIESDRRDSEMIVARFNASTGDAFTTLFSSEVATSNAMTIKLPKQSQPFVLQGWDVSPGGVIIYCEPEGSYGVVVGHPSDGRSVAVGLPEQDSDPQGIQRAIKDVGVDADPESVRRILRVVWLDDRFFLVEPTATVVPPEKNLIGTFEVFNLEGDSFGRHSIHIDFDPAEDTFFIRWDRLIVVRGAQSAMRSSFAALGLTEPEDPAQIRDDIRVDVYQLFGEISGH